MIKVTDCDVCVRTAVPSLALIPVISGSKQLALVGPGSGFAVNGNHEKLNAVPLLKEKQNHSDPFSKSVNALGLNMRPLVPSALRAGPALRALWNLVRMLFLLLWLVCVFLTLSSFTPTLLSPQLHGLACGSACVRFSPAGIRP